MSTIHPDYGRLAARISVSNLQKETPSSFSSAMRSLAEAVDPNTKKPAGFLSESIAKLINKYKNVIDEKIVHKRDHDMNYFGFKTLEKGYLLKSLETGSPVERPQYMWMRVALGIHCSTIDLENTPKEKQMEALHRAFESYELMSSGYFTHASPTLFTTRSYT